MPFIAAITLLGALATGISLSQLASRTALEDRFETRTELAAQFTGEFIEDILSREEAAASAFMSGELSPGEFSRQVMALGFQAAVLLDRTGRLILVHPPREDLIGKDMTLEYPHLRRAVGDGVPAVSPVVPSAAEGLPTVGFAVPFETDSGKRVFSGGFYLSEGLIAQFLRESLPFSRSTAALIDARGAIVASNLDDSSANDLASVDEALAKGITGADSGRYRRGEEEMFFSVKGVAQANWRVVAAVPTRTLLRPVSGPTTWVPWLVLALLAVSAVIVALAVQRLIGTRSELVDANEELKKANSLIGDFVGIASHDLRGPLTTVIGYASMLAHDVGKFTSDQRKEFAAVIERTAKHMKRMTEDLLTVSALESDGLNPSPQSIDLQSEVEGRVRESALDSNTIIRIPAGTTAFVDPDHFRRIVDNYLTNAHKYGETPVSVEVTLTPSDQIELRVIDSGAGVPPEMQGDLFRKFGSASRQLRSVKQSTGLGLSIVKALAESNGGAAWYESNEARRSCFAVRLPSGQKPLGSSDS